MHYRYHSFSLIIGILLSVLFLYLAFRGVNFSELKRILMSISPMILIVALYFYILEHIFRLVRWWWMMKKIDNRLSLKNCIAPYLISVSTNHLIPIRIGDLIRIFTYRKKIDIEPSKRAGIIVVERFIDFLVFLVFFYFGLLGIKYDIVPHTFVTTAKILLIVSLLVLLVTIIFSSQAKKACFIFLNRSTFKKWNITVKISQWTDQFFDSLMVISSSWFIIKLFFLSFILWFTEAGMFFVIALGIDPQFNFLGPIFAFALGALGSVFPAAPGMIGTLDYFLMLGVIAYGMSKILAASFAVLIHAYFLMSALVIGLYYIFNSETRSMINNIALLWSEQGIKK